MQKNLALIIFLIIVGLAFGLELRNHRGTESVGANSGQVPTIEFWDYWTGEEKEPLAKLVEKFNSEDHGFKVKMLTISLPRKKILMATVGEVPPDLVHLDGDMVSDFALRGALSSLDELIADLSREQSSTEAYKNKFIDIYFDMLTINNQQWALPLMPTCEAMHINKNLLSKHGLQAPKTLKDIKNIFDKTTDFQNFKEIGWLPTWPPWTGRFIPTAFGGNWGEVQEDGSVVITANSPENIKAWTWVQENFAKKIPKQKLRAFTEGFSAYQSPDNPFYTGRIILENNGVWEKHLAAKFAPNLDIEIVPFPGDGTLVTIDALAIPQGAKNPKLAFEFMNWLLKTENVEYLAKAQHKFSPLKETSPSFIAQHPNLYINTFIELAKSKKAKAFPAIPLVQKYRREIKEAYNELVRLEISPEEALNKVQKRMEEALSKL